MVKFQDFESRSKFVEYVRQQDEIIQERYGLHPCYQIGMVVQDLEEADAFMMTQGNPPSMKTQLIAAPWIEGGQEKDYGLKAGLVYNDGYEYELIEPFPGSDLHSRYIEADGAIVFHHVNYAVKDIDYWTARLATQGVKLAAKGKTKVGPLKAEFAYFDTVDEFGIILELASFKLFGINITPMPSMINAIGRWQHKL